MFDECLWAEEKNHLHNETRRGICLWLCWLTLRYSPTFWDARRTPALANDSNAVAEAEWKKAVIQTMEIYTDFWADFYFDRREEKSSMCG